MALVSVIMAAYNCENTVGDAVRSVQKQTAGDWELLVVNDASTDGTLSLLERMAESDARIQVLNRPANSGSPALVRNDGLKKARGEWVAFLDSDDWWESGKLERQLEHLKNTGAQLCYTGYTTIDTGKKDRENPYWPPPSTDYRGLLAENVVGLSTVLLRREILPANAFDPSFFHEDYALWLQLAKKGIRFCGIPESLVCYRKGGRSSNKFRALRERWKIYRRQEQMGAVDAMGYLCKYATAGLRKHLRA